MQILDGDIQAQTRQCLVNLEAVLKEAGSGFEHVCKTTVFLKDMNDFGKMNETYSEMFKDARPARSAVEVARLPRDVKVSYTNAVYHYLCANPLTLTISRCK